MVPMLWIPAVRALQTKDVFYQIDTEIKKVCFIMVSRFQISRLKSENYLTPNLWTTYFEFDYLLGID